MNRLLRIYGFISLLVVFGYLFWSFFQERDLSHSAKDLPFILAFIIIGLVNCFLCFYFSKKEIERENKNLFIFFNSVGWVCVLIISILLVIGYTACQNTTNPECMVGPGFLSAPFIIFGVIFFILSIIFGIFVFYKNLK